ncbi:hypothetical protein ACGFIV_00790 [Sphaerisporangium sp. NPDC049003]|uniref:hypothetical protein n=1 Tax=Sphaerisporangium sp. NPDC049003 TaxID=3364517 RepID=UPI00371AD684
MSRPESDYFDWAMVGGHAKGCKQTRWEIRERHDEHITGRQEIELQAVCPQVGGCGVAITWSFSVAPDTDPVSGDVRSGTGWSSGPVEHIGYGTKPTRAGEVWLHAGAPLILGHAEGPAYYLVTRSQTPPADWAEVLGSVAPARHRGRQVKSRWLAGAGYSPGKYGTRPTQTCDDRKSRTAAVAWVLERAADEPSPTAAADPAAAATPTRETAS